MDNFKEIANKTLNAIFDMIEKNYAHLDVDFEQENLRIEKDDKVFILSVHNPSLQIWLSSPLSGAHHFELASDENNWTGTRDRKLQLTEMLKNELDSLK